MNLVGHVAVAARRSPDASPSLLAGAMLPDLGAIARVRLLPTTAAPPPRGDAARDVAARDLAAGVALHHASDAAFHASRWFNDHNRGLRDLLLEAGVDRGPARACAHAGLEMLLDGDLVENPAVAGSTAVALDALVSSPPTRDAAVALVPPGDRARWIDRLERISRSLDPRAYTSAADVGRRLHRMTEGRTRIELRADQVIDVTRALETYQPIVARDGAWVVDDVLGALAADDPTAPSASPTQEIGAGLP